MAYSLENDLLELGGRTFRSRLLVGTGKYATFPLMKEALDTSDAEIITIAVRRVNLDRAPESLLDYIDTDRFTILPNTAGCYTADDAVRTAFLAREAGLSDWVKLEVIGDEKTLFPDTEALLAATHAVGLDGERVLDPAADVDVVDVLLTDLVAAHPVEVVPVVHLERHLALVGPAVAVPDAAAVPVHP